MNKLKVLIGVLVLFIAAGSLFAERLNVQTTIGKTPAKLHNETLTSQEKMGILLRMAEDFIGYIETNGIYVSTDALETGGGYFNASGSGVEWGRGGSNVCFIYAVLLSEQPSRQTFTKYNIPRSRLVAHLINALRSHCLTNKNCSQFIDEDHTWGGPAWQTSLDFIGAAWASHLMEKELDANTIALVKEIVIKEADNLDKTIPSGTTGDTRSEDCCWNAPFLAFAANKHSAHPNASNWDYLAKKWAMNAVSTPADENCTDLVDGVTVKEWMCTVNLFPDLTLENHNMWSVGYQIQMMKMAEAELAYQIFNKPIPKAFSYHADEMWESIGSIISLSDGDYVYATGQDWFWKTYTQVEYFARQYLCRGDARAAALESRALQMAYHHQGSDGSMGYDFGTSTVGMKRHMMTYLLHKYFPNSAKRNFKEMSEVRTMQYGTHTFPYVKAAIHRNDKKLVSVAWHPTLQPIYIIPDKEDTFEDPPIQITYNQLGGNANVSVTSGGTSQSLTIVPGVVTDVNGAMTVRYQRKWGSAVTQYVTVVSFNDEATVYLTHFKADADSTVTVGPLFPVYADFTPCFNNKTFTQYRGDKWLNINDCMGFVSPDSLPVSIVKDKFMLTDNESYTVTAGQWFSPAAVVVYVYQNHSQTEALKDSPTFETSSTEGQLILNVTSSSGTRQVSLF